MRRSPTPLTDTLVASALRLGSDPHEAQTRAYARLEDAWFLRGDRQALRELRALEATT